MGRAPGRIGAYGTGPKPIIYGDGRGLQWEAVPGYAGVYRTHVGAGSLIGRMYDSNNTVYRRASGEPSGSTSLDTYLKNLAPGYYGPAAGGFSTLWVRTLTGEPPVNFKVYRSMLVYLYQANGIVVEDLDLQETHMGYYGQENDGITLRRLNVHNSLSIALYFSTHHRNSTAEDNTITDSGYTAMYIYSGTRNIFRNNTIRNVGVVIHGLGPGTERCGIGLQESEGDIVEHNRVYNAEGSGVDFYFDRGSIIRYNYFENTYGGFYPHGTDLTIHGNVVNQSTSVYRGAGMNAGNVGPLPIRVFHNTFYGLKSYAMMGSGVSGPLLFRNNIVHAAPGKALVYYTGDVDSDYNCFYADTNPRFIEVRNGREVAHRDLAAFQTATGNDKNSTFGAPKLSSEYALSADSPCRNAGFSVANLISFEYRDAAGLVLPQGSAPDVGAFEYPEGPPSAALAASLTPSASVGTAPISSISLNASVSGSASGTVTYHFYCNRSAPGIEVTTPDVTLTSPESAITAASACSYSLPGTYIAKVIAQRGGHTAEARALIVATPAADSTPPVISNVKVQATPVSATVTWSSDEATVAFVEYGTTSSYGTIKSTNESMATNHSYLIRGLTENLTYHFRIRSTDWFGNESISKDYSFATGPAPEAPQIKSARPL